MQAVLLMKDVLVLNLCGLWFAAGEQAACGLCLIGSHDYYSCSSVRSRQCTSYLFLYFKDCQKRLQARSEVYARVFAYKVELLASQEEGM